MEKQGCQDVNNLATHTVAVQVTLEFWVVICEKSHVSNIILNSIEVNVKNWVILLFNIFWWLCPFTIKLKKCENNIREISLFISYFAQWFSHELIYKWLLGDLDYLYLHHRLDVTKAKVSMTYQNFVNCEKQESSI